MPNTFNDVARGGIVISAASVVVLQNPTGGYMCLDNNKLVLSKGQFVYPDQHKPMMRSGMRNTAGINNAAYVAAITICKYRLKNKITAQRPTKVWSHGHSHATYRIVGSGGVFSGGESPEDYTEYIPSFTPIFDGTFFLEHQSPNNLPEGSDARSMFAWVRVPEYTTAQSMFGYGGSEDNTILEFLYSNSKVGLFINYSYENFTLEPNTWYLVGYSSTTLSGLHYVCRDSISAVPFYPSWNDTTLGNIRVGLGIGPEGLTEPEDMFVGDVVSMGIWDRQLSNDEVLALYNAGRTTYSDLPSELKTTFTTVPSNAQSRSLHLENLQARSVLIEDLQANSLGGAYQAARFNGGSQVVINSAPTNVVSVSVWAQYDAVNSNGPIIVKGSNAWNSALWDWGIWADNNNFYAVSRPGGSFCTLSHDNTSWYHIVLVRDNGSGGTDIYLNGNLAASDSSGNTNSQENTIYIGGVDSSQYIPGAVGEIQLFDYALSSSEVFNMYNYGNGVYGSVNDVGLIAGYHLNNDLIDYVDENNGVWGGAPAFTTGGISTVARQSANFTGSNRIAISIASDIVAISIWVNFSSSSSFGPIIVKGDDTWSSTSWDWGIFADASNFYAVAEPAGSPFCTIPHDNDVWYHLVLVRNDGSGGCSMYVNGVSAATGTASDSNALGDNVFIGGVSGTYMIGQVQEVQLFSEYPSPSYIANLYNYGVGIYGQSIPVLLGGYHLDGSTVDYSNNSNDGTWTGTAAYTTGITDKIYKAASFDGGSRIAISSAPTNVNSVSVWVRSTEGGSSGAIITKGNDEWNDSLWDWSIWHDSGNTFYAIAEAGSWFASYEYSFNTWYHLVIVRDNGSGQSEFYVNSNLIGTGSAASTNAHEDTIYIGGTDHYFNGQIQEVQLFSSGLSPEDVALLYHDGRGVYGSSIDAGLISGYHLDGKAIDYVALNDASWSGTENYVAGFMTSTTALEEITTSDSFTLQSLTEVSIDDIRTSSSDLLEIVSPTIDAILTSDGEILQFGTLESSDAGLVGFWDMTETEGTRYDSVGGNHLEFMSETASFTYDSPVGRGNPVSFTDDSTLATSWFWDFGDDSDTSSDQNPTHTYNSVGTFGVTLVINGHVSVNHQIVVEEPVASFTSNTPQSLGDGINFTDTSTYVVSWLWDFGDETTSTEQNPSHVYDNSGEYTVSLEINGNISNTSSVVAVNSVTSYIWDKVDLSPHYNMIGFVTPGFSYISLPNYGLDGLGFGGSWETGGFSMNATALGDSPQTFFGVEFDTPVASPGNDVFNTIRCTGQVIPLHGGQYTELRLLGFITNAPGRNVSFVITYSDDTTDIINQNMSDWFYNTQNNYANERTAVSMSSRISSMGDTNSASVFVHEYYLPLDSSKNAVSITLPSSNEFTFICSITQASLIAQPASWIKSDEVSNFVLNGSDVAMWLDRSGHGNHFIQSNASFKPTYQPDILNGLPVVQFSGSNYMQSTVTAPNKYSVIAVYKQTTTGNFSIAISWGSGTTGKTFWSGYILGTANSGHLIPASDSGLDNYSAAMDDTDWHIVGGKFDGTNLTGSDFGVSATPADDRASGTLSSSNITIGGYGASPSLFWTGYIAEVLFFNSELSDNHIDLIISYLTYKYNLVSQNEVQTISLDATPTSGSFSITVNGQIVSNIPYWVSAGDVQNYINGTFGEAVVRVT